jgi:hypothetical protein
VQGGRLVDQRLGPVRENVGDAHAIRDCEGEVEVREAIAAPERQRTDHGCGENPAVLLG